MWYVLIVAIVVILLMPFSIRNRTKQKQEQIKKKAAKFGIAIINEEEFLALVK